MATRPGQRRTARLVVLLGGATALIAAGVAARWWIRWPERVREQLAILVSQGEFEKANRLLAGGAEWRNPELPALDALLRMTLHDGAGETLELSFEEWKELFTDEGFTARTRTSADYLHARQVLELAPGSLPRESPSRLAGSYQRQRGTSAAGTRWLVRGGTTNIVLTIERGTVSVSLARLAHLWPRLSDLQN